MKLLACLVGLLLAQRVPFDRAVYENLQKLAGGTWVMQGNGKQVCEKWKLAEADQLHGKGFIVRGADTSWQETVTLTYSPKAITFTSVVTDQNEGKAVPFVLSAFAKDSFVFTNPAHDFPQEIGYRFVGRDSLDAWIGGQSGGRYKRVDYHYRRKQ